MAFSMSETLTLNIEDLSKMEKEFNNEYKLLFSEGQKELKNAWILKLKAMNICEEQYKRSMASQNADYDQSSKYSQGDFSQSNFADQEKQVKYHVKAIKLQDISDSISYNEIDVQSCS